jgi:ribulose-5-phosphate 4-epimerase/fuculose-1-phosphate aldolase
VRYTEPAARQAIVDAAHSLFGRGLTHGRTGNLSVRVGPFILVTPTGSSLGTLTPDDLSVIDHAGNHIDGQAPSKEAFLHAAILRSRPADSAVIHTHSTYSVAVSCLPDLDPADAIPPITAYFAMRVGQVALLPYYAPGDSALEPHAERIAGEHRGMLLAKHGPVVAAKDVESAMDALEELEQTAKLFLLLRDRGATVLDPIEASRLSAS